MPSPAGEAEPARSPGSEVVWLVRPAADEKVDRGDPLAHAQSLLHLALRLARTAADAEDLVQETYVRAFRALGSFTPGTNLRAWLFRILRNAFLDTRRRDRHAPVDPDVDALAVAEGALASAGPTLQGDEELHRLRAIVGSEIEAALRTLSEDARTVVLLDAEGLTEAEVAEVMGCAVGTVKSRLGRARALLRERLADYRR